MLVWAKAGYTGVLLTNASVIAGSAPAASQAKVSVRSNRSTMGWALKSAQKTATEGAHPPDDHVAGLPKKVPKQDHDRQAHEVQPRGMRTSYRVELHWQQGPDAHMGSANDSTTCTFAKFAELSAQQPCFAEQAVSEKTEALTQGTLRRRGG